MKRIERMKYLFLAYSKCSTCRTARQWLDEHQVVYEERPMLERPPSVEELKEWIDRSGRPIKSFFNTSGLVYKALNLKDKLPSLDEEAQIALLASDGKLVKRPLLIGEGRVWIGFKPDEWGTICE